MTTRIAVRVAGVSAGILLLAQRPASAQWGERVREAAGAVAASAARLPGSAGPEPGTIESGQVVRGQISRAQEIDRFQIQLEAGQEVVLFGRMTSQGSRARLQMALRNPDGREKASGLFQYDSNLHDQATRRVRITERGTYTVEVADGEFRGTSTGPYELEARVVNTGMEPGETPMQGLIAPVNRVLRGRIDHAGDIDRYPVALRRGDEVVVYARVPHPTPRITLTVALRNPDGREVESQAFGYDSNLRDQATQRTRIRENGTFTVELEDGDFQRASTGEYEIEISIPGRTDSPQIVPAEPGTRPDLPTGDPHFGPGAFSGVWSGTLTCVSGSQPMRLVLAQTRDGRVDGIAHLGPESDSSRPAYTVRGTSDAGGRLVLRPVEVLRAPSRGWSPPGIEASVSPARLSGRVTESSCSTLELNRQ